MGKHLYYPIRLQTNRRGAESAGDFRRPAAVQRGADGKRPAAVFKFQPPRMEEQPFRRRAAVKGIAENRAAQAFHGNPQLVGFAGLRLQYEQPQISGRYFGCETVLQPDWRRRRASASMRRGAIFHPALDQTLFFSPACGR